jgi:methionyl-tRNA formyltransferase
MRIAVLGTGPFAVPMFQSLVDSPHEVAGMITRPIPAVKGRDKAPHNPMREAAEARGVAVHAPESINSPEGKEIVERLKPELLVVCDYGQILAAEVLGLAPLGGINLHASLLPKFRGAAPIQWALLHGERETGVSVIHMTPRLDAGPILTTRTAAIGVDETHPELERRLADLGIAAVQESIEFLSRWDRRSAIGSPQDSRLATKAPRLKKEQGAIDWSRSAEQIRNQVRALKPWPGTYTFWHRAGHEPLRLVVDAVQASTGPSGSPGTVLISNAHQLEVATGDGAVSILALQPAGKRLMPVAEFLRGYHVREGDIFGPMGP